MPSDHLETAPVHLNVLPSSGKVDALKSDLIPLPGPDGAMEGSAANSSDLRGPKPMHKSPSDLPPGQRLIEGLVVEVLRTIFDPEIPVNIYDLGLIYEIEVDPESRVKVMMTLTAPACPVAGSLPGEVEKKIESIPAVKSADVVLVWDPPWDKSRMSEAAMLDLGF